MTETDRLEVLLTDDRLPEKERTAFQNMLDLLNGGKIRYLSADQRKWVDDYYKRYEKDAEEGSLNLHSRKLVPQGIVMPKRHYETMDRPTKPPGRG